MYLPLILMENVCLNPQDCLGKEVFQLHNLGWMPKFSFLIFTSACRPQVSKSFKCVLQNATPIRLLMCSKLSKHINVPSSRDGVAHMVLYVAELVPKTCREAAIRKLTLLPTNTIALPRLFL